MSEYSALRPMSAQIKSAGLQYSHVFETTKAGYKCCSAFLDDFNYAANVGRAASERRRYRGLRFAKGDTNVGSFEGGAVVGTVAAHENSITK